MTIRFCLLLVSLSLFMSGCVVLTKRDGEKIMSLIQGNEENILQNSKNIDNLTGIVAGGFKLDLEAGHQHQMSSFYRSTALQENTQATLRSSEDATKRDHSITGLDLGQFASKTVGLLGSLDPTGTALTVGGLLSVALNMLQGYQTKKERTKTKEWEITAQEAADTHPDEAHKVINRSKARLG